LTGRLIPEWRCFSRDDASCCDGQDGISLEWSRLLSGKDRGLFGSGRSRVVTRQGSWEGDKIPAGSGMSCSLARPVFRKRHEAGGLRARNETALAENQRQWSIFVRWAQKKSGECGKER
jgi:hypothetical protein